MGNKNKLGFTLIELLVVIFIIGVLATLILINFTNARGKSNYTKTLSDMNAIGKALGMYSAASNGKYPAYSRDVDLINDVAFKKYMPTPPINPCSDYKYFYSNNYISSSNIEVGVYLKHSVSPMGFLYYLGISNFQPYASYELQKTPISIYDVEGKSFSCDAYEDFESAS